MDVVFGVFDVRQCSLTNGFVLIVEDFRRFGNWDDFACWKRMLMEISVTKYAVTLSGLVSENL